MYLPVSSQPPAPHLCQMAVVPNSEEGRADSCSQDLCSHSGAHHWTQSKHPGPPCTVILGWKEQPLWLLRWLGRCLNRHQTILNGLRNSYLINIFTFDAIASVASWALSTLPGTIREAGALRSSKAGVRQAPIWEQQCWLIIKPSTKG